MLVFLLGTQSEQLKCLYTTETSTTAGTYTVFNPEKPIRPAGVFQIFGLL